MRHTLKDKLQAKPDLDGCLRIRRNFEASKGNPDNWGWIVYVKRDPFQHFYCATRDDARFWRSCNPYVQRVAKVIYRTPCFLYVRND